VMTKFAPAAAFAGEDATAAPRWAKGAVRSAVRFQTITSCPAWSKQVAIGVPISPSPRNPILAMFVASIFGHEQRAAVRHRNDPHDRKGSACIPEVEAPSFRRFPHH
jgi:hypothetical protein